MYGGLIYPELISIHAPTRGATRIWIKLEDAKKFQSTLPQGERHKERERMRAEIISIHAPTRGATSYVSEKIYTYFISIHAPTRGATGAEGHILQWFIRISIHAPTRGATNHSFQNFLTVRFQSTLPQGERRSRKRKQKRSTKNFNPRSHKGSDLPYNHIYYYKAISIHAPTRGATIRQICFIISRKKFQSTLPQGERLG